jgi:hypothetical protein
VPDEVVRPARPRRRARACASRPSSQRDAFRAVPEPDRSSARQKTDPAVAGLTTSYDWNTYRVVHTRSAG